MSDAGELHRTQPKYGKGPIDLVLDPSVSDGAVRQYIYMHWRYGKNKQNFEGRESIAEALHISERTVTNHCAELESAGYLVITRKSTGKMTRNFYDLFETREECSAWRKVNNILCKPRETKKPKTPRKLRSGVGGQPTHAEKSVIDLNSSSTPDQSTDLNSSSGSNVNSSSGSNVNSSSGDLDSVFNQTHLIQKTKSIADTPAAVSAGEVITPDPSDEPNDPPITPQQAMFGAICAVWGYEVDSLTRTRKKEVGGVASELVDVHADPARLPAFKTWLDQKAKTEQWRSYTINAMKKYWPDYVAATAPPAPPKVHKIPDGWCEPENQRARVAQWYAEHQAEIEALPEVQAKMAQQQAAQGGEAA